MYSYVKSKTGENEVKTPVVGRTVNTQSSQVSAQRNSKNSTLNSDRNPPDQENILMRDILSNISNHEDNLLHSEDEDIDIDLGQPFEVMPTVGETTGDTQVLAITAPSHHAALNSQFSDINWEAMDGSNEFPDVRSDEEWNPDSELRVGLRWQTKDQLNMALRDYSIRRHQTFKVDDSDSKRLIVRCPRVKPEIPVKLIMQRIRGQYGYNVSYKKAWAAKQLAIVKFSRPSHTHSLHTTAVSPPAHHLKGSSSFSVLFRSSLFPSSSTPSSNCPLKSLRIVAASCSPRPVVFLGGLPGSNRRFVLVTFSCSPRLFRGG
ncbi:hypothetical protein PIB30_035958 [Stylosanthes scabra]|uniref:Transposase MuDR plant domain-containing protein n=1 Tax=Stylosanthes scabra TaxID=79078 RepID=A0ABU6QCP9_9FABA|nr:hypothetical protein [Stylosanthes scabra]